MHTIGLVSTLAMCLGLFAVGFPVCAVGVLCLRSTLYVGPTGPNYLKAPLWDTKPSVRPVKVHGTSRTLSSTFVTATFATIAARYGS